MAILPPNIRVANNRKYILCAIRKKWLVLTPEEKVRQFILHRLINEHGYPQKYISVEKTLKVNTGSSWLDQKVVSKWKKNPGLMLYKLQSNGYKFSWLLIPLSLPFLWLVFAWRRQFKAYDHAVFITYSLSFMSLLFIVMSILSTVPGGGAWAALLFLFGVPLHLYKQLRNAYGLSRFSAFWRWCVLLFCIQIVLMLFLLVVGALGAF